MRPSVLGKYFTFEELQRYLHRGEEEDTAGALPFFSSSRVSTKLKGVNFMPEGSRPAGRSPHLVCRGTRSARGGRFKFGEAVFFCWLLETATSVCRVLGIKRHF